ncbi:Putative adenylate kinase 7 [Camponotus floridanus]|uniref:Putative adenylate kinase 7 n=1 Tax=Camponotus floridanus TaxID=104421 RepID=E2AP07_CAMFO|nr:Putative adenylate kinase 7 [Camponotus floridanus]
MDSKRNTSIIESTAADTLDDLFGFEAARKRQEDRNLKTENMKPHFKPWRVLSDTIYMDPLSTDVLPNEEDEEFQDEYVKEEEREKRNWPNKSVKVSRKYEVIGTVLDSKYTCPENVTMITSFDKGLFLSELMTCGIIIYDITQEPGQIKEICWVLKEIVHVLENMEKKSPKTLKRDGPIRHIILISTIMTWALTKPLDPTDPDLPFTEADYRKRKPHPNYKEHIRCEREIVIVKKITNLKDQLKTLVICCGHLERAGILIVQLTGDPFTVTSNLIFRIVVSVLQNWPPMRYIVAVEQEIISQNKIVKKISQGLTTGKIKNISKEEALLLPEVSHQVYDQMTVDLNIDPVYIIDRIHWHLDMPFQNVVDIIIKEYKAARNLRPVKIIVLGPPASGKTRVARYLANHYEIHYIHVKTLISDTIQKLINDIEAAKLSKGRQNDDLRDMAADGDEGDRKDQEEEVEEQDEKEVIVKLQEQLDEIRTNMAANNGRLDDAVLNKLFLNRLKSKDCLNQGYVMDGYPKTIEQARKLFMSDKENLEKEVEQFEDENIEIENTILPELVIVLEASDEFLKERVINLPEKEIQNTHYTEEHMLRRLKEYRY